MKKIIVCISFILIISCVASSERMRADDFFVKGEYTNALRSYELALTHSTTDSQRTEIQQKIEETKVKIVDDVLRSADAAYKSVEPPSVQSIDEAVLILKGSDIDDKSERISAQIKTYQDAKINIIKNEAEKMKASGEYLNALVAYQRANKIDPEDKELTDEIKRLTIFMEKEKKSGLTEINKLLKTGNGKKAKVIFDKIAMIDPEDPQLKEVKDKISVALRKQLLTEALEYESQKKFFTAYTSLKNAEIDGLDEEISRIGKEGSEYYFTKAEKYFNTGDVHLAYITSVKAMALSPNDIQISQINKKCADIIDTEIQKHIAIITFGSPANHPDYGMLFSDALITRLFKELPYGINIVAKEKISLLKDTTKMKIKNIGGSLGADYIINGTVSLFKVENVVSKSMAAVKVKVGEELEINPEYEKMIQTYGTNQEEWPSKPEMKILRDKYEIIKYQKGSHSKKAFGNVSVRLFDASNGEIIFTKDFDDSIEKTDHFQDMVEGTDIQYDPLELPSDTEINAELRNKMLDKISSAIAELLRNREKRFLKYAISRMERNEYKNAIKFLAQGYLFCNKSKTDNEYARKIYNMMTALTEID